MELFQLRSFLRVAEEGNLTRAAESLYLTQPAVTQHIQALERELGVSLFDRTGRGMRLTPAGEALREYVQRSMVLLDECRQVISDLQAGHAGRLLLGAGVTTSIFHLPSWLRAFREAYPGIEVVVRTGGSREVADMALEREIDLGLITSPMQHPDLRGVDLFEEEIVLVIPPDHPLAGKAIPPEEFDAMPLILFPKGTGFREYLDKALDAAGVPMTVKMETDSVEAIKSFVAVGLGASFLPAAAVESELRAKSLAGASISGLPPLKRRTSVVYRTDRYLTKAASGFLAILADCYQAKRYKTREALDNPGLLCYKFG